jgi:hypothetical protein
MAVTLASPNELSGIVNHLKARPIYQNYQAAPAALTGVTTAQVLGLGVLATYAPQFLPRVKVCITGGLVNSSTNLATVKIILGTGTPPAAGSSATAAGIIIGAISFTSSVIAADEANVVPFTAYGVFGGLTLGTTYWFDLSVAAAGSQTETFTTVNMTVEEI